MALPLQDSAHAELGDKDATTGTAAEERTSSGHQSSSSSEAAMPSSDREDAHQPADSTTQEAGGGAASTPPPTQLMDRQMSSDGDQERIPASVFERDPTESNKDWSMMSTESVFALQVAPSSDFTGFFLAHPELMDIATPPRPSSVATPPRTSAVDADADAKVPVVSPPFESIPELPDTMKGNYSFAFPNLIEDKRNSSKKPQHEEKQPEAAAPTESAEAAPAPAQAEAQAQRQASSKPEAAPAPGAGKGGLFACFPCC